MSGVLVQNPEPIRRTAEIEEITNLYFIHPAASRLVPLLARMHFTPNAVSLTGMLFGILAGLAYYHYQDPRFAVAGFILMLAWHVMDGADGQLARLTRSQSQLGKVLDGISDNVTFLSVYAALAIALSHRYGDRAYVLVLAAAVCHLVQAASYELQRQEYDCWGWGRKSDPRSPRPRRLLDFLQRVFYECLSFPAAGITRKLRVAMTAALQRHPERAAAIRQRYRETFGPHLREWSLLSANYRSLGIFVGALLRAPEYYFWFDIIGFSVFLGVLLLRQRACGRTFLDALDAAIAPRP